MKKRRLQRQLSSAMSVVEHLGELRTRIFRSLVAVAIGAVICFIFFEPILRVLTAPYQAETGQGLIFTHPLEAFITRLKVAAYGGVALTSPVLLWHIWRFVTPGLYPNEKRYAVPFIIASTVLFAAGVAIAVTVFPIGLSFLLNMGGPDLEPFITAGNYLSLLLLILVAFAFAFQLPVLIMFLLLVGVLNTAQLRRWRRNAFLGILVASSLLTPQDPFSLFGMAIPLYLLYEGTILLGRIMRR